MAYNEVKAIYFQHPDLRNPGGAIWNPAGNGDSSVLEAALACGLFSVALLMFYGFYSCFPCIADNPHRRRIGSSGLSLCRDFSSLPQKAMTVYNLVNLYLLQSGGMLLRDISVLPTYGLFSIVTAAGLLLFAITCLLFRKRI